MAKAKHTIEILVGLPGSGKSSYAKSKKDNDKNIIIVDCDDLNSKCGNIFSSITDELSDLFYSAQKRYAIVDGLFLTTTDIIDLINKSLHPFLKNSEIILVFWKEDRETCLANDKGRRKNNSTTTIKNAKFEEPNLQEIKKHTMVKDISIVYKTVTLKPDWKVFADSYEINNGVLYSEEWIVGGYEKSYNEKTVPITPEPTPDFLEFDELLEESYPNITYLQYKKLYRECVSTKDRTEHDYYCGETHYRKYCCNVEKLYMMLQNYGIVLKPREI